MVSLWKHLTPPPPKPFWQKLLVALLLSAVVVALERLLWPASLGKFPFAITWLVALAGAAWYGGSLSGILVLIFGFVHQIANFPHESVYVSKAEFSVRIGFFVVFGALFALISEAVHQLVGLWRSGRQLGQMGFASLARESPGFVWSTQARGGGTGFVSRALDQFLGGAVIQSEEDRLAFVHPADLDRVRSAMSSAKRTLTPYQIEYRIRGKDGAYRWILEHGVPRTTERDRFDGFIGLGTDITQSRKEREELMFLGSIQHQLASTLDLEKTAAVICENMVPCVADWCMIQVIRETDGALVPLRVHHSDPERVKAVNAVDLVSLVQGTVLEGTVKVARDGKAQYVRVIDDEFLKAASPTPDVLKLLRSLNLRSFIGVPLRVQGRIVGVLSLATGDSQRELGEDAVHLVTKIAGIASFAVENGRLYRSVKEALETAEKTRRDLEASDQRFRSAWESGIFGMCIVDRDGSVRSANDAFLRVTGQTESDLSAGTLRLRSRIDEREVPFGSILWERIQKFQRCEPFEKLCIRPDGIAVPVLVGGSLHPDQNSCIVFLLDLTERKRMESALDAQRALLHTIIDAVPAMVGYIGNDRRLVLHNRRYDEWLGYSDGDLNQIAVSALHAHGSKPEEAAAVERAFNAESVSYETRITTATRDRHLMVNLRPDTCPSGKVQGVVVHAYDITEPKLLAAAVARSEKRYRTLVTATAAIVWATDSEGVVRDVFGWEAFTGRRMGSDKGADWMEAIHPEDRDHVRTEWRRNIRGARPLDLYYRLRGADGRYRHVHSRSAPLVSADGQVEEWIGYVSDITQRVEAEQQLRRKEAELQLVVDTMPALVSYVDNRRRYVFANEAYRSWFNMDPQELRGRPIEDVIGSEAYARTREHIDRVFAGEIVMYQEFLPYLHGKGRWVEATLTPHRAERGDVVGYFALIIDVTERKGVERERVEMLERYRFLADAMPQNVWTTDGRGVQDSFNERWTEYTGISKDSDPNSWPDFVHPDDVERTKAGWMHSVSTGELYRMEHRLRGKDGHYRWFLSMATPRRDSTGAIVQWVGSSTNIDPFRTANAELAEARSELRRHADNLEVIVKQRTARLEEMNNELEAFSYSVSHDLRVPLQHIQVFVQSAIEDSANEMTPETLNNLKLATSSAERMDVLITDLLAYSRLSREEMELQKLDLGFLVAEGIAGLRASIEARKAEVSVEGQLPSVFADRIGVQQVVRNLLGNALKFVPKDRAPRVRVYAEERGSRVRLWIEDNGIGIDARHHNEVFKLFKRVHSQGTYSGTGIGLSLVRKAMTKMGGECGVESSVGNGSRFWVEFEARPASQSGESLGS